MYRVVSIFFFVSVSLFGQEISGHWSGNLELGGHQLKLSFKISKDSLDYACFMNIPQQNVDNLKIQYMSFEDSTLIIKQPNINLEFVGRFGINNDVHGDFKQNGVTIPLILKREKIIYQRPQEPKTPFEYSVEEIVFTNSTDDTSLAGTLTIPRNLDKFPIAIIIGGSGPQNRDGEIMGHKPFLVMANFLTNNGIAVLRFDERGTGESTGIYNSSNIENFTSDVVAAINYIKSRKDLNPINIGLIGHSLGGIIAAKVASIRNDVNFIIFMATPAIRGNELMLMQKAGIEKKMGIPKQQTELSNKVFAGAYNIIKQFEGEDNNLKDTISSYFTTKLGHVQKKQINGIVNQLTSNEIRDILKLQPSKYLSQVYCPVFALNGDKDLQVNSEINLKAIENALQLGGNSKFKIRVYEGLNHLFQESMTGLPNEYFEIEQTIALKVLREITAWILELSK